MDSNSDEIPAVQFKGTSASDEAPDISIVESEQNRDNNFDNVKLAVEDIHPFNENMVRSHGNKDATGQEGGATVRTTSQRNRVRVSDVATELYFCKKEGGFEHSIEHIRQEILKDDIDGEIHGAWLLTELDHWDNEYEKVVILTRHSLLVVRYDFITHRVKKNKRIGLHIIQEITIGDIIYPKNSLMPVRNHGGIQLIFGDLKAVPFMKKWNPFSSDMPSTILCHHKLLYNEHERESKLFNVDNFCETLCEHIKKAIVEKCPNRQLKINEETINVETYASLSSMIFNQSHLGFNRDRNGVSF